MKLFGFFQVLFGLAIYIFSYDLTTKYSMWMRGLINRSPNEIVLDFIPKSATVEFILLGLGLMVLIFGFLQMKANIRGGSLQIVAGLITGIIYIILSVRALTVNGYGDFFILSYVSLVLGPIVSLIGIYQIVIWIIGKIRKNPS
jgi:hypothetical protein